MLLFSHSVMYDSLWSYELQQARLPCLSLSPGVCSNLCPLSQWCHPTISSSVASSPLALNLPQHQVFSSELALCIRWPKYWSFSFSISPSSGYSGLMPVSWTFRMQSTLRWKPHSHGCHWGRKAGIYLQDHSLPANQARAEASWGCLCCDLHRLSEPLEGTIVYWQSWSTTKAAVLAEAGMWVGLGWALPSQIKKTKNRKEIVNRLKQSMVYVKIVELKPWDRHCLGSRLFGSAHYRT